MNVEEYYMQSAKDKEIGLEILKEALTKIRHETGQIWCDMRVVWGQDCESGEYYVKELDAGTWYPSGQSDGTPSSSPMDK